jgi:hypothetical protein
MFFSDHWPLSVLDLSLEECKQLLIIAAHSNLHLSSLDTAGTQDRDLNMELTADENRPKRGALW